MLTVTTSSCQVGLAFLTMFFSRAEILCQNATAAPGYVTPEEIVQWCVRLHFLLVCLLIALTNILLCTNRKEFYSKLFALLQGSYASLFPTADVDDAYVWQFLAAVAVGANIEQQHVLVTEVR